jgi:hypothetical protein
MPSVDFLSNFYSRQQSERQSVARSCLCIYQGCQMVYFQTKNPKFWRVLQWKILVYFTDIRSIFLPLDIFYGRVGLFCGNLVSFPRFG